MENFILENAKFDFVDELRVEGINCKGYGVLPKYVMLDTDLTIESKGIYAYYSSYAGAGNTAFPSRDKIIADLMIDKSTYYKYFRLLVEQGYISVQQLHSGGKGRGFKKNIYTLISNPKKFKDEPENIKLHQAYDLIRAGGINAAGFGFIPKTVMLDKRLPLKAKAIYAYFCVYTGSGNAAFPKRDTILFHLGITEMTYYKFYKPLISLNYITSMQRKVNGKLSVNDYYLNHMPDATKVVKKTIIKTHTPYPNSSYTQKPDNNINNLKINNININNQSINQSENTEKADSKNTKKRKKKIDRLIDKNLFDIYLEMIKSSVEYDTLLHDLPYSQNTIDEMLLIIADTLSSTKQTIRIRGEDKPADHVKGQLLKLSSDHIRYVNDCMDKTTTKIHNIRAYLLSALYNSTFSLNSYYQAEAKNDLFEEVIAYE